jgi:hypothetical protein
MKKKALLAAGIVMVLAMAVYSQHRPGGPFSMMDTDNDGKISRNEWKSHHNDRINEFNRIDANNDNSLTDMELRTFHMKKMRSQPGHGFHGPKGPMGDGGHMPPKHGPNPQMLVQKMDADNDGKISRSEWDSHHSKLFSDLDANGDSSIMIGEFIKFHESMKGTFPGRK